MWGTSVAALNQYVADTVTNPDKTTSLWYGEANINTGARTGTEYGALAAFFAGTLALSGDLIVQSSCRIQTSGCGIRRASSRR